MCPACPTTVALIIAGTTSAGGLTAFVLNRLGTRLGAPSQEPASGDRPDNLRPLPGAVESIR